MAVGAVRAGRARRARSPSPGTERTPPHETTLVPLLLLAALLAGCGEKEDVLEPSGSKQRRADARLLPQRRPRRHLRRAGGRALRAGGPRRGDPPAARPGGADQAGGRRARGPGDLVRARGAARPRPGPARGRRRRARAEAAHLDHLAAGGQDPRARRPRGQDRRHRGDRLPVGLPADDPRRGRRAARLGQGAQRRLQPDAGAAHRARSTPCWAPSGTTRAPS